MILPAQIAKPQAFDGQTFDGSGASNLFSALMVASAPLKLRNSTFVNAPRDCLISSADVDARDCSFSHFGQNPRVADHLELIHIFGGQASFIGCTFDGSAGVDPKGGVTGLFFAKTHAAGNPITLVLYGCTFKGSGALKLPYAMQLAAYNAPLKAYIGRCAIEKGSGDYIGKTVSNGWSIEVTDLGGNVDLVAGAPIGLA